MPHSFKLIIANKYYSSWSLRPWLLLKHFNIPFAEEIVQLGQPDTEEKIKYYSPSGRVPVLLTPEFKIWDSFAICEFLAETFPDKAMWPNDRKMRAWARSVSHEIHSGFAVLRERLPMKCGASLKNFDWSPAADDIARIQAIWSECLVAHQQLGPYLFGEFSIADCMYAPVIIRFRGYGVPLAKENLRYHETMLANPALQAWLQDASQETWRLQRYEAIIK